MKPFALGELSAITHTLAIVERARQTLLVVSFAGSYRDGSAGAPDAQVMRAAVAAGVVATRPDGVVLDLRELTYRWGNNLLDLFLTVEPGGFRSLSYAIVVSERCGPAVRSLLADAPLVFESLDDAIAHATAGAEATVALEDALEEAPLVISVRADLPLDEILARVATVAVRAGLAVDESSLVRAWSCGQLDVRVERLDPDAFAARAAAGRTLTAVDGAFAMLSRS